MLIAFACAIVLVPQVRGAVVGAVMSLSHLHYDYVEENGVRVYYQDADQAEILTNVLPEIQLNTDEWFSHEHEDMLHVVITRESRWPHLFLAAANGVYFPSQAKVFLDGSLEEDELVYGFSHEYLHHVMFDLLKSDGADPTSVPNWFHEGVAEAFAYQFAQLPFSDSMNWWDVVPYEDMRMDRGVNPAIQTERYRISHFTVEKMKADEGSDVVGNIVRDVASGARFEEAFEQHTGETLSTYHTHFKSEVEKIMTLGEMRFTAEKAETIKALHAFDDAQPPYYYAANTVYDYLNELYYEEGDWQNALEMRLKSAAYVQDHFVWRDIAELSLKTDELEKAERYAQKALVAADEEWEEDNNLWYDEWFNGE